jgi:hypothetical protein
MANGSIDYNLGHLKADMEIVKEDINELKGSVAGLSIWRVRTIAFFSGVIAAVTTAANGILFLFFQ